MQPGGFSMTYDDALFATTQQIVSGIGTPLDKSLAIYAWIVANIAYDCDKQQALADRKNVPYRCALQTYQDQRGICGEMASLQVVMERLCGNSASLVRVFDFDRPHACAVSLSSGRPVLVDPAQQCYVHNILVIVFSQIRNPLQVRFNPYKYI